MTATHAQAQEIMKGARGGLAQGSLMQVRFNMRRPEGQSIAVSVSSACRALYLASTVPRLTVPGLLFSLAPGYLLADAPPVVYLCA